MFGAAFLLNFLAKECFFLLCVPQRLSQKTLSHRPHCHTCFKLFISGRRSIGFIGLTQCSIRVSWSSAVCLAVVCLLCKTVLGKLAGVCNFDFD